MKKSVRILMGSLVAVSAGGAWAACGDISFQTLSDAANFVKSTAAEQELTGGLKNNMWVTFVDETGKVCQVVNTAGKGQNSGKTWGVSRVISAQKANTSALLSLDSSNPGGVQAWVSGALMLATQPVLDSSTGLVSKNVGNLQGTLWGVQFSNPVNPGPAYAGSPSKYGTNNDPMKNKRIGGINVFGGGITLYNNQFVKIGAIGVSGDTSCTDHAFAWRVREQLAVSGSGVATAVQVASQNKLGADAEQLDISSLSYPDCIADITPKKGILNGLK